MNFIGWTAALGGVCAFVLSLGVFLLWRRRWQGVSLFLGLLCFVAESIFQFAATRSVSADGAVRWQQLSLLALGLAPGPWLVFALTFARGNPLDFLRRWAWMIAGVVAVGLGAGVASARFGLAQLVTEGTPLQWTYKANWPVIVLQLTFLLTSVVVLMNLEGTFRVSVGTARWRIKYAIIGLAVLFGARIYGSSQVLLYSGVATSLTVVLSSALGLASLLIGYSLVRSRFEGVDVYPSSRAIHHTVTTVLIGIYLLVVGALSHVANLLGGDIAFPVKALLILMAMALLGALGMSDRVRQRLRLVVARHFSRPVHDYRQVWSAVTEHTSSLTDRDACCRVSAKLISEVFDALSVSIWLQDERAGRLVLGESTSLTKADGKHIVMTEATFHLLAEHFRADQHPCNLEEATFPGVQQLRDHNPSRFPNGGPRFVIPLQFANECLGVMVLGDRVRGLEMTADDLDLLKCVAEHLAATLRNLKLSGRLLELREFEALQTMSAFLVHDLKNTASTLSLMLRNMETHFDNPEFRQDAVRGLGRSVAHINDLIARLTSVRRQLNLRRTLADVNAVFATALKSVEGQAGVEIVRDFQPVRPFLFDEQQIESVLTNLLINAREALPQNGVLRVGTIVQKDQAVLSVTDNGCGMTEEFMARSLFRPFQTTKKRGLGIGMFQSKMIVDAHGGRVEVESKVGHGTCFRVFLPMQTNPPAKPAE